MKEEGRGKKEEGRRKKEEGRRKREEGRRKRKKGRRKKEEGRRKRKEGRRKKEEERGKKKEILPLSHSPTLPLSHSPTLPLSPSPPLPLPVPTGDLEVLRFRCRNGSRLIEKQVFRAVVLVNAIDFWLPFQWTSKAKGVHAIFAIAHLLLIHQLSLFENCPVVGSQHAPRSHAGLGNVHVKRVERDVEAHVRYHRARSKLHAKFRVRGAAIDKFPRCHVLRANRSVGTKSDADPDSQNKDGCEDSQGCVIDERGFAGLGRASRLSAKRV